jgi:hypothetical protein
VHVVQVQRVKAQIPPRAARATHAYTRCGGRPIGSSETRQGCATQVLWRFGGFSART